MNIKSYEATKVYRDYSITGTDGFKPLWNYEEGISDVILNTMKVPCTAGNNARKIFPLALFYNKVNRTMFANTVAFTYHCRKQNMLKLIKTDIFTAASHNKC